LDIYKEENCENFLGKEKELLEELCFSNFEESLELELENNNILGSKKKKSA
jgi:hypothetical protein